MTYPACANAVSTVVANATSLVFADTRFRSPMRTADAFASAFGQPRASLSFPALFRGSCGRSRAHRAGGAARTRAAWPAATSARVGADVATRTWRTWAREKGGRAGFVCVLALPRGKGRSGGTTWMPRGTVVERVEVQVDGAGSRRGQTLVWGARKAIASTMDVETQAKDGTHTLSMSSVNGWCIGRPIHTMDGRR